MVAVTQGRDDSDLMEMVVVAMVMVIELNMLD